MSKIRFLDIANGIAVRQQGEELSTVHITRAHEGQPIPEGSEYVLIDAPGDDGWQNVRTIYRNGPAQVATQSYREGYDRIFGKKARVGVA